MSELSKLPNVGKVLETLLLEVGIQTPQQLREIGTKETFLRIRTKGPTACLHMLYGVQGAVEGIPDKFLSDTTKQELREFYKRI